MLYIVIISLLGCAAVFLAVDTVIYNVNRIRLTRNKTARFYDRTPQSYAAIHESYFSDTDITYAEFHIVWRAIGVALYIDPRYLLPGDELNEPRIADNTPSFYLFKISSADNVDETIRVNAVVGRGLKKPIVKPQTIRDAVYLCLGRSLPEVPNHPKV